MNRKRFFRTFVSGVVGLPLVASVLGRPKPSRLTAAKVRKAHELLLLQKAERIINPPIYIESTPWGSDAFFRNVVMKSRSLGFSRTIEEQQRAWYRKADKFILDYLNGKANSTLDNAPPIDSQSFPKS